MTLKEILPWLILMIGFIFYSGYAAAMHWDVSCGVTGAAGVTIGFAICVQAEE